MTRYLDDNGVAKLWGRIQRLIYECGGGGGCTCDNSTLYLTETKTEDNHYYYYTLNKTYAEIKEAWDNSRRIVIEVISDMDDTEDYLVNSVNNARIGLSKFEVLAFKASAPSTFSADVWQTDTSDTTEHPKRIVAKPI